MRLFPERQLVRCVQCGLAWPEPIPTFEELREIYESDSLIHQYKDSGTTYVAGSDKAEPYILQRIADLTTRAGQPGRILDIGAAQGAFLKACQDRGWQTTGIELSPEGRDFAKSRYGMEFLDRPVEEVGFPEQSFEAVHMNHVFEHVIDPMATLREIHRILVPGGWLVIEVPNEIDDLFLNLSTALGRGPDPYPVPSPHIFHFNAASLRNVLTHAGFNVHMLETPRRNADLDSRIPLGGIAKKVVFGLESFLRRGPVLVSFSQKT